MKNEQKSVYKAFFSIVIMVLSTIFSAAIIAQPVVAANGDGAITQTEVDGFVAVDILSNVITTNESKELVFTFHNDEPEGPPTVCVDEIILKFPDSWQGQIDTTLSSVTNLGDAVLTNERNNNQTDPNVGTDTVPGKNSGVQADPVALRIQPGPLNNGKLCPDSTSVITLVGLQAPVNPEVSRVEVWTSDQSANEPSASPVRSLVDVLPLIHVTDAEYAVVHYMDLDDQLTAAVGGNFQVEGQARGAWARLNELYLGATITTQVNVYLDDGDNTFDAGDFLLTSAPVALQGGEVNTVVLNNYNNGMDVVGNVENGFVRDYAQAGSPVIYHIRVVGAASTLTLEGHADEDGDQTIDPTYTGTGFSNPTVEGTVLNVENTRKRHIHVQLVEQDEDGRELYVRDDNIPIYFTTSLSSFEDASPRLTESDGETEIILLPGTIAGIATVDICFPDPSCTVETVGIAPGAADHFALTKGLNVDVEAGQLVKIEATIYDQYNNVISNSPQRPDVTFRILSEPAPDADLDDDANPPFTGDGDNYEEEPARYGIGDADLKTSVTVGDHLVEVCVENPNLGCLQTTITGTLGQGNRVECTIEKQGDLLDPNSGLTLPADTIYADQCVNVRVNIHDKNDNPLPKWESIVRVSLEDLDIAGNLETMYIQSTDLREEVIAADGKSVQGKLNNNDPAYANVLVCGCAGLGDFDVFCESDTLQPDNETLFVRNSKIACIDVTADHNSCSDGTWLQTSIVDTCFNKVVDQECSGGASANSCVALQSSCGELSTATTCVDLGNTGMADDVYLDTASCGCGDITVTATDVPDCCPEVYDGTLPMCNDLILNKVGPASQLEMQVYPDASNQDNFYVSELSVVELTAVDACGQVATCDMHEVDVELSGEDCVDDTIQVDSPLDLGNDGVCAGSVNACETLTPYGQTICGNAEGCGWEVTGQVCAGAIDCSAVPTQGTCEAVGCEWSTVTNECGNEPVNTCADFNVDQCSRAAIAGCTLEPVHECVGQPTSVSCEGYNYEQCALVGDNEGTSCAWNGDLCSFDETPVHKVVIENCLPGDKASGDKEWTDLPEKVDIVVDKIAFEYNGETTGVIACIYEETEDTAGFQANEDLLWRCVPLDQVPTVPPANVETLDMTGAWDSIHDGTGVRDGASDVYYIELMDRVPQPILGEYDNQRMGGSIVEPGDTKDFYLVLKTQGQVACGEYDADYLFFQDYNSPDVYTWTPYNGHVRDTVEGTEEYTIRNDAYPLGMPDPYPVNLPPIFDLYGFGDRVLHNLKFVDRAYVWIHDLVAEEVSIFVDASLPVVLIDNGLPVTPDNQAKITYLTQPATQVVAINHGDLSLEAGDEFICDGDQYAHANAVWNQLLHKWECPANLLDEPCVLPGWAEECRPAMACEGEGYDINLQVTDGFQNQVGLATEVQLHSCLLMPRYVYLGDSILPGEDVTLDLWGRMGLYNTQDPWAACFDLAKFRAEIREALHDMDAEEFAANFLDSPDFVQFVEELYAEKTVDFVEAPGYPFSVDPAGHLVVTTDNQGRAIFRVESDDSSMFQIRSFDTSYRVCTVPHALDADCFDIAFSPGEPAAWDIMAYPQNGIPADGEQEASVLIRKVDACGNPVVVDELATVIADSPSGRAVISRDFSGNNNYDNSVTGSLSDWTCMMLFPWFEDCSLQVLNDVIEDVTLTVQDVDYDPNCDPNFGDCGQTPDSTVIGFVGAPVQLTITEIVHSDLIPADGYDPYSPSAFELPMDACTVEQVRECELYGHPDICAKECVQYGQSGAWVDVEIQDKYGTRVQSYLGDGFAMDPGDTFGLPDYVAEKICVALDDPLSFVSDYTYGWVNLEQVTNGKSNVYCGDLYLGKGSFKVSYAMQGFDGQPLDSRESRKVIVSVFDACDAVAREPYAIPVKLLNDWDDQCNAQEYNENNLPDSETATRLRPDYGELNYIGVPDRWDISADKLIVAADGKDYATVMINVENEYFDVRASLDATVQSSLLGSKLESEQITPGCYVEGTFDPLNPTSINVHTEACSGGRAKLKLTSTEPGTARVTVSGNGFGCKLWLNDLGGIDYTVPVCAQWGVIPLTPKVIEVEFKQSFQNELNFVAGWNFFSVPVELAPANDQWGELGLDTLCSASAMWNEPTQSWQIPNAATPVDPLEGYWCYITAGNEATLAVTPLDTSGGVFLPPVKTVYPGWNDVGLSTKTETLMEHALISIDSIYTMVLDWVESLQSYHPSFNTGELGGGNADQATGNNNMYAGQGYWVRVTANGDLAGLS